MEVLRGQVFQLLTDVRSILDASSINCSTDILESAIHRTEVLLQHLNALRDLYPSGEDNVCLVTDVLENLRTVYESLDPSGVGFFDCNFQTPYIFMGTRGRPRLDVPYERLKFLFDHGFSATDIARLLQVSLSTVRRMDEFGMRVRERYSNITDEDLDDLIREVHRTYPNCGYRMMEGHLLTRSIRVQQYRVREAMLRTDLVEVITRGCYAVHRRIYNVPGPNALWHIDGNHKLIR